MRPSDLDPVLEDLPDDDVGAETQARFRFQADCAARDCIRMLTNGGPIAVVCEWHEDYVVVHASRPSEIVSVKHRELGLGPWTLKQLIDRGGLAHLYGRWLRLGKMPNAKLCTNAGLKPGPGEAAGLGQALFVSNLAALSDYADAMCSRFGAESADVLRFLRVLTIEHGLPHRAHISRVNAVFIRAALKQRGLDPAMDQDCYERLVERALQASRDDPLPAAVVLAFLERPDAHLTTAVRDMRLTGRTIDRSVVLGLLRDVSSGASTTVPRVPTRLRAKLEAGGFGPTAVHRAQKLRAAWYAYSRAQPDFDGSRLESLRDVVHERAEASESATSGAPPYGLQMSAHLRELLLSAEDASAHGSDIDVDLLMGCAFQLTDECLVWWSSEDAVEPR